MKFAILTDSSMQWFSYIVCISNSGEAIEWYKLDNKISNDYLSSILSRGTNFNNLILVIPGETCNVFYGTWISEYEFRRIRRMIELYPSVEEYYKWARLEIYEKNK